MSKAISLDKTNFKRSFHWTDMIVICVFLANPNRGKTGSYHVVVEAVITALLIFLYPLVEKPSQQILSGNKNKLFFL